VEVRVTYSPKCYNLLPCEVDNCFDQFLAIDWRVLLMDCCDPLVGVVAIEQLLPKNETRF